MNLQNRIQRLVHSSFISRTQHFAKKTTRDLLEQNSRPLEAQEIAALERQGNRCSDWSLISVVPDFTPKGIWDCSFFGTCRLGTYTGELRDYPNPGMTISLPEGLYSSTIIDSFIGNNCAVHRCSTIQGIITSNRVVLSNSSLRHTGISSFGNGTTIPVGVEIGGREIMLFADLSLELAQLVLDYPADQLIRQDYLGYVGEYLSNIWGKKTIVDNDSLILDTRHIQNAYIGPHCYIHQCDCIQESTLLSTPADPTEAGPGTIIRQAIVQEGVTVDSGALVLKSMLFEHSYATEHGKVQDCIVGPNSGISLGEATASFMGPFVGFHHQSLLIANYWPGGRGNIGYGANVGSNHTSRMPDQECWPGEGMFFGLSSVIKYPANFRRAPYSIVAAGVTTLPQKMTCPFSLINEPVAYYLEVPPGFNNLIPAWGLTENLYSLKRNEGKYKARNKAKRNTFDLELFRPEILQYMREAIQALSSIAERKTIYLPSDIPAIGKNMMTDENRLKAIKAYQFFIDLTEYKHLRNEVLGNPKKKRSPEEVQVLGEKITAYLTMVPEILQRTILSRQRDFARGSAIIDDYPETHVGVDDDPFVIQTRQEVEQELEKTRSALALLKQN